MSETHNTYLAMRYFEEIMTDGNLGTLYELLAPDFVFTLPTHPEPYVGPDGFKELVTMLHGCFPDFYIHAEDMVASGDTVVTRWRGGGTHLGGAIHTVAGDVPPSGRAFEIDGVSWHRFEHGKIVEVIGHEDTIGMFEQLGIMPSPRSTTSPAENLALAHRFVDEVLNAGRFAALDELLHDEFEFTLPTMPALEGKEALRSYVASLRASFADLAFEVVREVAADDRVALRWRITGTHVGEFAGVAPSGNAVDEYGIDFFEFWGGRISAVRVVANQLGLTNQLRGGGAPAAPEAS